MAMPSKSQKGGGRLLTSQETIYPPSRTTDGIETLQAMKNTKPSKAFFCRSHLSALIPMVLVLAIANLSEFTNVTFDVTKKNMPTNIIYKFQNYTREPTMKAQLGETVISTTGTGIKVRPRVAAPNVTESDVNAQLVPTEPRAAEPNGMARKNATLPQTPRLRFTQGWSTGHVGTRFLTSLLAAPSFFRDAGVTAGDTNSSARNSKPTSYLAWNEVHLPLLGGRRPSAIDQLALSLDAFQGMMAGVSEFVWKECDSKCEKGVYCPCEFGQWVKDWNFEGNRRRLNRYLQEERLPALTSVFQRYSGQLNHAIKVGHTSIFYDLGDYYETFVSGNMEVDFIRIQRNRIDTANSFVAQKGREGPCVVTKIPSRRGFVTCPEMKTAMLRLESIGGILPDDTWDNWSSFQQYLWFVDEVEARWRKFLTEYPEVRYHILSYTNKTLSPESLDDLAVNFLNIDSVSPYAKRINRMSHRKNESTPDKSMSAKEKERQAIAYSNQAPWCSQYEGPVVVDDERYPRIDCSILA